ncbi:hypothetical protein Thimo_1840 [Thioflavicoccus mobilis 8321]|uniref:Hemerythrin-like domain-containing protein n=1 Tax=Thioflavicoccus mobilis 8321 TaxID=765912 RepID=L0GV34_9GAMM|nr:hemerythrin domain-containing protein [Thioflavicoccus mobilis]AGA90608.1 hypothetical protein Thimo_1840 [Thioflavicoccus mobilis 8321]
MNPLIQRLNLEHKRLARLLDLLQRLVDRFGEGNEPDFELLCEMLEYMEFYADQVHHKTEDLIFERLLALDVEKRDVLDTLMHQHRQISQINRRFRRSLEGIVNEEVLRREEVEIQGRELIAALRQHMDLEEREAFPVALDCLADADWAAIEDAAPDASDPVFVVPDTARFLNLYRELGHQADPSAGA